MTSSVPAESSRMASAGVKPFLILHVGTHKTGSTAIQDYLAQHTEVLAAAGFVYPRAGRFGNQHAGVPGAFLKEHAFVPADLLGADPDTLVAEIRAEVPENHAAILSSEVCWELLQYATQAFPLMMAALEAQFRPVIIYMVRDEHQKSWSSIKHLARSAIPMDVVDNYQRDVSSNGQAHAWLEQSDPARIRIEYDGRDSVEQFLRALAAPDASWNEKATPTVRARRGDLVKQRVETRDLPLGRERPNGDFVHAQSAAVTLSLSMAMAGRERGDLEEALQGLPRLYNALFTRPLIDLSSYRIPDDDTLGGRLRTARSDDDLLTVQEWCSIADALSSPKVRLRALARRSRKTRQAAVTLLERATERQSHG